MLYDDNEYTCGATSLALRDEDGFIFRDKIFLSFTVLYPAQAF